MGGGVLALLSFTGILEWLLAGNASTIVLGLILLGIVLFGRGGLLGLLTGKEGAHV